MSTTHIDIYIRILALDLTSEREREAERNRDGGRQAIQRARFDQLVFIDSRSYRLVVKSFWEIYNDCGRLHNEAENTPLIELSLQRNSVEDQKV